MRLVCGIDLGTTNSVISIHSEDSPPRVISIDNSPTVPSIVAEADIGVLVGKAARQQLMLDPNSGVRSIKRHMADPGYSLKFKGTDSSPTQISSLILAYLKTRAEEAIGQPLRDAVITVPAYFKDHERIATKEAGELAGFNVLRIINEPTAASLAYKDQTGLSDTDENILVYDLGGGTFDVSVIRCSKNHREVLASTGNAHLGGDDFDELITEELVSLVRSKSKTDPESDIRCMSTLRFLAEDIKIALSSDVSYAIDMVLPHKDGGIPLRSAFTRTRFEELIEDLIDSTIERTRSVIVAANLEGDSISKVLLVGGSTRIPLVAEKLSKLHSWEISRAIDPDISVSLGAAIQAAISEGMQLSTFVIDVAPHSLGIAAYGELDDGPIEESDMPKTFVPLIRRNTPLPSRFSRVFYKGALDQKQAIVQILQGDSKFSFENSQLGKLVCNFDSEDEKVIVTFAYTVDGTVKVEVAEESDKMIGSQSFSLNNRAAELECAGERQNGPNSVQSTGNFLSQKVRRMLNTKDSIEISSLVARYEELLGQDDKYLDEIEDKLHDWLDSVSPS